MAYVIVFLVGATVGFGAGRIKNLAGFVAKVKAVVAAVRAKLGL